MSNLILCFAIRMIAVHVSQLLYLLFQSMVEFRNIGGVSRHLRLIPLKSDYFSVSPGNVKINIAIPVVYSVLNVFLGCFPTEDGLIAPGMQCSFTITFTPDSLANYSEEMQVHVLQYGDTEPPDKGYSGTVILSLQRMY